MNILTTFILLGMVDSHDEYFATVELNTNPATNGGPATAVMPVSAFPCEIREGKVFYIVKLHDNEDAVIICQEDEKNEQ
jgi:hypothetical protein|tara:strand:- start:1077 stop:1313 length:237 start_codon:yes stop_codon:yes gene_type:complete